MGTHYRHYVMVGAVITKKHHNHTLRKLMNDDVKYNNKFIQFDDNAYEDEISKTKSGLHFLVDGFNGEYAVFGRIIAKANDFTGFDMTEIDSFFHISRSGIDSNLVDTVKKFGKEIFDVDIPESCFKTIVFTYIH